MPKGTQSVDAKELACYFYEVIKRPVDNQIGRHIVSIKKLLNTYTKDEIKYAIKACSKNPPAGGIYSFGFISWAINEKNILAPYRKAKATEQAKQQMAKVTDFGKLPEASNSGSKLEKFGVKKEFNWDA